MMTVLRFSITAFVGVFVIFASISETFAQQNSFEIPKIESPYPRGEKPRLSADQGVLTVPVLKSNTVREIPQAYLGCWQARIDKADSWQRVSGPRVGFLVPNTHTICFRQTERGGVRIAYRSLELDEAVNQGRLFNFHSETYVTANEGNRLTLRGFSSSQQRSTLLGLFRGPLATVKSVNTSNCEISSDAQTLLVDMSETKYCSGAWGCSDRPWLIATWHGAFYRVPDPENSSKLSSRLQNS